MGACGYPQSIYIWSQWWEVCSFFQISELLEVIQTLKCEELSPRIKLSSSGRCMGPDMLEGGRRGGDLSVLIGYKDTGDPIREGGNVFYSARLGTRGHGGRRQRITRPPTVSGQIDLFPG